MNARALNVAAGLTLRRATDRGRSGYYAMSEDADDIESELLPCCGLTTPSEQKRSRYHSFQDDRPNVVTLKRLQLDQSYVRLLQSARSDRRLSAPIAVIAAECKNALMKNVQIIDLTSGPPRCRALCTAIYNISTKFEFSAQLD